VGEYNPTTWTDCFGSRTTNSGDSYVGEYKNGKANGFGTYTFADGHKYVGNYDMGKRNGAGKEYGSDGKLLINGEWTNGQLTNTLPIQSNTTTPIINETIETPKIETQADTTVEIKTTVTEEVVATETKSEVINEVKEEVKKNKPDSNTNNFELYFFIGMGALVALLIGLIGKLLYDKLKEVKQASFKKQFNEIKTEKDLSNITKEKINDEENINNAPNTTNQINSEVSSGLILDNTKNQFISCVILFIVLAIFSKMNGESILISPLVACFALVHFYLVYRYGLVKYNATLAISLFVLIITLALVFQQATETTQATLQSLNIQTNLNLLKNQWFWIISFCILVATYLLATLITYFLFFLIIFSLILVAFIALKLESNSFLMIVDFCIAIGCTYFSRKHLKRLVIGIIAGLDLSTILLIFVLTISQNLILSEPLTLDNLLSNVAEVNSLLSYIGFILFSIILVTVLGIALGIYLIYSKPKKNAVST